MKITDKTVKDFTQYRRRQVAELRPWQSGDDMSGVSVSAEDAKAGSPKSGDMIARNPKNHADQWLVAAAYFAENFEPIDALSALEPAAPEGQQEPAESVGELFVKCDHWGAKEWFQRLVNAVSRRDAAAEINAALTRPAEQAVTEEWREIKQQVQPRIADGYTAVAISKPGYWLVKGPGPAALSPAPVGVTDDDPDGAMTPEEIRLENLKQMAAYEGPVVSFEFQAPFYIASCDQCGWVGSSERCGTDSWGDDSDVHCPQCFASTLIDGLSDEELFANRSDENPNVGKLASTDTQEGLSEAMKARVIAWQGYFPGAGSINSETNLTKSEFRAKQWKEDGAAITPLVTLASLTACQQEVERLRSLLDRAIPDTMGYDAESNGFYDTEITHDIRAALGGQSNE